GFLVYRMKYANNLKRFILHIKKWIWESETKLNSSHIQAPIKHNFSSPFIKELSQRYEGKLLLKEEISLPIAIFQKLVNSHYFVPITSIQKHTFYNRCVRCHNKENSYFAKIPCLKCNKTHIYCRKCILMGRVM